MESRSDSASILHTLATKATAPLRTGREDSTERIDSNSVLRAALVGASNAFKCDEMRLRRTTVATWRIASFYHR